MSISHNNHVIVSGKVCQLSTATLLVLRVHVQLHRQLSLAVRLRLQIDVKAVVVYRRVKWDMNDVRYRNLQTALSLLRPL